MFMRKMIFAASTVIVVALVAIFVWLLQEPARPKWNLFARDDHGNVVLCFSREADCDGSGLALNGISIRGYDYDSGQYTERMWEIEPGASSSIEPVSQVTYGVSPAGWRNVLPPKPIRCGSAYAVDVVLIMGARSGKEVNVVSNYGDYYFTVRCEGGVSVTSKPDLPSKK